MKRAPARGSAAHSTAVVIGAERHSHLGTSSVPEPIFTAQSG